MPLTYDESSAMHSMRDKRREESRKEFEAVFTLAGFKVARVWELYNGYWPDTPEYDRVRAPWWLMLTEIGPVQIGWRKRVINIRWDACTVRHVVTEDEVTKGDDHVHAYSVEKAVEYLKALRAAVQVSDVQTAKGPQR